MLDNSNTNYNIWLPILFLQMGVQNTQRAGFPLQKSEGEYSFHQAITYAELTGPVTWLIAVYYHDIRTP